MQQRYVQSSLETLGIPHGEELIVGVDEIGFPIENILQQTVFVGKGHIGINIELDPACFHMIYTVAIIREPLIADGQQPYLVTQHREHGHLIHHYGGHSRNRG